MLVAAAVCPQTPLLVPQIAGGAAGELADVRSAALDAVARLCEEPADLLLVIAPAEGSGARERELSGSFRRFGVDLAVGGQTAGNEPCCGLLLARWLLDAASPATPQQGWELGQDTEPQQCAQIGRTLAARAERVAMLVMGDGSARRTLKAPGYFDERAEPFDDAIAAALAAGDPAALASMDAAAAGALMAAARAPLQTLAAAATTSADRYWRGELLSYQAPYGVGYFTALWTAAPSGPRPGRV
jgi:hypothetical protein